MAWRCSGRTNKELVDNLLAANILKNPRVSKAMYEVDRGGYSPRHPYEDRPQSIGYSATISAPHMHAYALEELAQCLKEGSRALDIGSGSGYLTACMAKMVGASGRIVGVEHVKELVQMSEHNLNKSNPELKQRVKFVVGDGRKGYPADAPYDCIHVGAASEENYKELEKQLKEGGRMFIPVEDGYGNQTIVLVEKEMDGQVKKKHLMGVMYVPLTSLDQQLSIQ